MIEGISHITYIVSDLDRAADMFEYVFDAKEVYSSGDETYSFSRERFFLIHGIWIALMQGDPSLGKTYNHIAFKIPSTDQEMYLERINNLGLEVKTDRNRIPGEGVSIYFYDYDDHLFELHSGSLEERLGTYLGTPFHK